MRGTPPSLFLDEDVPVVIAKILTSRGIDCLTATAAARRGLDDEEQLGFALESGRVLLTHNRGDFEVIARRRIEEGMPHNGIIIATRRSPGDVARRVMLLVDQLDADDFKDSIRYI